MSRTDRFGADGKWALLEVARRRDRYGVSRY